MTRFSALRVRGGRPLEGATVLSGSKNASIKAMAAALLSEEPVTLRNIPPIGDVEVATEILAHLGVQVERPDRQTVRVHAGTVNPSRVPDDLASANRFAAVYPGALLSRVTAVLLPPPGGNIIGTRPLAIHDRVMEAFGVTIQTRDGDRLASCDRLSGCEVTLEFPSTTATELAVLLAARADGRTVIRGGAVNPEILDLLAMLRAMGARFDVRDGEIVAEGVRKLHGVTWDIISDRNEAATLALAVAAAGGSISVERWPATGLSALLQILGEIGVECRESGGCITMTREAPGACFRVESGPYPSFESDWMPLLVPAATQCRGASLLHETVFENRFRCVPALQRLGLDGTIDATCEVFRTCRFRGRSNHRLIVNGRCRLRGSPVAVDDLRGGASLLIAALTAEGTTTLTGTQLLNRGYDALGGKFRSLGAVIIGD